MHIRKEISKKERNNDAWVALRMVAIECKLHPFFNCQLLWNTQVSHCSAEVPLNTGCPVTHCGFLYVARAHNLMTLWR